MVERKKKGAIRDSLLRKKGVDGALFYSLA